MEKEFVKCKVERCNNRKGDPAVKIDDSFPKKLLILDDNEDIFILHEKDSDRFTVCQLSKNDEGYNILYIINAKTIKDINNAMSMTGIDDNSFMYFFIKRFIKHTIFYENTMKK